MHYVYLIKSINEPEQTYVGYTTDLKKRLNDHNYGKSFYTQQHMPWELIAFLGFKNKMNALEFEMYLKSHSGRAFAEKRLW